MAELNAGLLQVAGLSDILKGVKQERLAEQQKILGSLGSLAETYQQDQVNQAIWDNVDPTTGKLNQEAVIQAVYKNNPLLANRLSQQYAQQQQVAQQQQLANMKTQAEIGKMAGETAKFGADAGKTNVETKGLDLKRNLEGLTTLHRFIANSTSQEGLDKAVEFAQTLGIPIDMYKGAKWSPELRNNASAQVIDEIDKVKNAIEQQKADSGSMTAAATMQNAGVNQSQLGINQQIANQNYEINKEKNIIDAEKARTEAANKNQITPYQRGQMAFEERKAANELEKTNTEIKSKIQGGFNNLNKANKVIDLFVDNAKNLLKNPLIGGIYNEKTGEFAKDKNGELLMTEEARNNKLGTWGNVATNDSTFNIFNKGSNEYKQLKAEYDRLALQAIGKGMQDLKSLSADGSLGLGGASDREGSMMGVLQNTPDFDTMMKMDPKVRMKIFEGILKAAQEDKEYNNQLIEQGKLRLSDLNKQQSPTYFPSGQTQNNSDNVFKASNNVILTPARIAEIERMMRK